MSIKPNTSVMDKVYCNGTLAMEEKRLTPVAGINPSKVALPPALAFPTHSAGLPLRQTTSPFIFPVAANGAPSRW